MKPAILLRCRGGFSLLELLVAVGIIGLLASIVFPFVSQSVARAEIVRCMANLRQIGSALQAYASDNEQTLPGPLFSNQKGTYRIGESGQIFSYLAPYLDLPEPSEKRQRAEAFYCPAWKRHSPDFRNDNATIYTLSSSNDGAPNGAPFGYPQQTTPDGSSKPSKPPMRLPQLVNRSASEAVRDVIFDKDKNLGPHGPLRNVLFLDWHVETVDMAKKK